MPVQATQSSPVLHTFAIALVHEIEVQTFKHDVPPLLEQLSWVPASKHFPTGSLGWEMTLRPVQSVVSGKVTWVAL